MSHIHELYDFVVTVYIVHDSKVLFVHHPRYGKWIPVGGHIELNEDVESALFREIEEETGLSVEILSSKPGIEATDRKFLLTPNYIDVHEANAPHKHISLVYFARAKSSQHKLSGEHSEIRWLSTEDLEKSEYSLPTSEKFYCKRAIQASQSQ